MMNGRFVFVAVLLEILGCAEFDDVGELDQSLTVTSLTSNKVVFSTNTKTLIGPGVTQTFSLNAGEAVYLYGVGTTSSNRPENMLDALELNCDGQYIKTTRNHVGTAATAQAARVLFVAPTTASYSCTLFGSVFPRTGGDGTDYHTYLAGAGNTQLTRSIVVRPCDSDWSPCRWGTESDVVETFPETTDGIYVGPHSPNGISEYVLHGPRFNPPAAVPSLDVYAQVEVTACYAGTASCPSIRQGGASNVGTTVELRLMVQQMASTTSSTVCHTTYYPAAGPLQFTASHDEHHKKAHLAATDVPFWPGCGRSFIVKTLATWIADADAKVEYGHHGTSGFSSTFVYGNP